MSNLPSAAVVSECGPEHRSVLAVHDCAKVYPGALALAGVDFHISAGEVRALLGKNGAGKSTLVKVLAGVVRPDRGEIRVEGELVHLTSPQAARDLGIGLVNQELAIVPELSVAENIYLGRWSEASGRRAFIARSVLEEKAAAQLAELGVRLDPKAKAGHIPIAHQQIVEIARALSFRPRILVLDEPTSSLPLAEVDRLLEMVKRLASRGVAIIYVSHRMDEIPRIADSVTVLRDGRHICTRPISELNTAEIVRLMTGGQMPDFIQTGRLARGSVALRVDNVSDEKLSNVSFDLKQGEIVGLAGLLGSGRTRLLRTLYGLSRPATGKIEVIGHSGARHSPTETIAAGVGFAPEDRKREGLALNMSVSNNLVMSCPEKIRRGGFLSPRREEGIAARSVNRLAIKIDDARRSVGTLSGGNQQKVVLGKCLNAGVRILLLDEPTRGVDIEAKNQIYDLLQALAAEGMSILIASSEMEELFLVCHRLLIMAQGRIVAAKSIEDTTLEESMQLAMEGTSQ
jgi:ABC-type sugar transport system ATPase subunit